MLDRSAAHRLEALASQLGTPVCPEQVDALLRFCGRLLEWNARINLTGARTLRELVDEHLVDALALAGQVVAGTAVDVGAGGGLPGVPFAILRPEVELTLVEPRAKRVAFLRTAVRELGLRRARVEQVRVEDLVDRRVFEAAWSRATFSPVDWLPIGLRIVPAGGRVFVLAQRGAPAEGPAPPSQVVQYDGRELRVHIRRGE